MLHNHFRDFIMEITAGRVCQMMSKGAVLAAGQQRKAFEVSNLKINLLGVGKERQNPQGGTAQVTPAHVGWDVGWQGESRDSDELFQLLPWAVSWLWHFTECQFGRAEPHPHHEMALN